MENPPIRSTSRSLVKRRDGNIACHYRLTYHTNCLPAVTISLDGFPSSAFVLCYLPKRAQMRERTMSHTVKRSFLDSTVMIP